MQKPLKRIINSLQLAASHVLVSLSTSEKRPRAKAASSDIVVRSPRLAAIGVATLSGLMLNRRDSTTTHTITEPVKSSAIEKSVERCCQAKRTNRHMNCESNLNQPTEMTGQ